MFTDPPPPPSTFILPGQQLSGVLGLRWGSKLASKNNGLLIYWVLNNLNLITPFLPLAFKGHSKSNVNMLLYADIFGAIFYYTAV